MRQLTALISYAAGPILFGLVLALVIIVFFPGRFNLPIQQWLNDALEENTNALLMGPVSYSEAVDLASPSVVNIYTLREQRTRNTRYNALFHRYSQPQSTVTPSTGSGVVVSPEGYIVTNLHVVGGAKEIRVALQDGREAEPEIIGVSKEDDMAVLKIDLDDLQAISIGDPDRVKVGDVVLAIGNPFGVGQTVTQGIISGTRRKGLNIAEYENFLQTDAAINPGNSGGALIDAHGRLLGINIGDLRQTYYGDASGIGFAIPADRVMQALADIVDHGRVVRGWLGVSAMDINSQIYSALQLDIRDGVLLTDIYENGPADIAGLLPGDIVTAINGNSVTSMSSAIQEFGTLRPGDIVTVDVRRGINDLKLEAVLSANPNS